MKKILPTVVALCALASGALCAPPALADQPIGFYGAPVSSTDLLGSVEPAAPLSQVNRLDLTSYQGTWHQIAVIPQLWNLQCARDTTATYTLQSPTTVGVKNRCRDWLGNVSGVDGRAVVRDPSTDASLRVWFDGVPFQNPEGPTNYRVTYLSEDGSIAIVGTPQRTSGFVLSRTPTVTHDTWSTIKEVIASRGWSTCDFVTTPTPGSSPIIAPLCVVSV